MIGIFSSFVCYIGVKFVQYGYTWLLHPCECMSLDKYYVWILKCEYHE